MYLVKTFSNKRLCYNKMLNYKQELHEKKKKKKNRNEPFRCFLLKSEDYE